MFRLFRSNQTENNYKQMSTGELRSVVRKLVKNKDLATLKAIAASGVEVDRLPYRKFYQSEYTAVDAFILNYIHFAPVDNDILRFLFRSTNAKLPSLSAEQMKYLDYLLNEAIIRNDQDYLKTLWNQSGKASNTTISLESLKKYLDGYTLSESEITSAVCCLSFCEKKNRVTPEVAAEIKIYLNSLKPVQVAEAKVTPGI